MVSFIELQAVDEESKQEFRAPIDDTQVFSPLPSSFITTIGKHVAATVEIN